MMTVGFQTLVSYPRNENSVALSIASSYLTCTHLFYPSALSRLLFFLLFSFAPFLASISHAHSHLDHCGALPYFTEVLGYDGPIFMTVRLSIPFSTPLTFSPSSSIFSHFASLFSLFWPVLVSYTCNCTHPLGRFPPHRSRPPRRFQFLHCDGYQELYEESHSFEP